ncbi:permease [Nocardiopsis sp. RSe5-2]|uniref:Permease n=1 Tax=Nocardiopsis endophytica TaxID=3018445 RepID=A0ABT4UAC2_9ACTN|nr:permease [Nocardiopsis endophytica]MDA2813917.1 permease [Nocardiopsis endophytica]
MSDSPPGPARPPASSLGDSIVADWDGPGEELPPPEWGRPRGPRRAATVWLFAILISAMAAANAWLAGGLEHEAFLAWATVFTAISFQALPFLVFGVALSAALTAFVPASFYRRIMPRNPMAAVPVAGLSGAVLPGCECASVPIAGGLIKRGIAPAAALTFLLAAPAINPVVLVATAVAFPGQPEVWVARLLASLGAAVVVGWIWARLGKTDWLRPPRAAHDPGASKAEVFRDSMVHDLIHAGGFLVVGAIAAATLNVAVPREWVNGVGDLPVVGVLVLAALAILLSICSEADAFVAASLNSFSPTAQLAFMVVGPMVDLKLIALQAGTFGWGFVRRFVPLTLAATLVFTFLIGGLLL